MDSDQTPPIDWPVVKLNQQRLTVRWTLYVQWLMSKRRVDIKKLPMLMKDLAPELLDTVMECFAAAVAENFTTQGLPAPSAEHWALVISNCGEPDKWQEVSSALWTAVGKARPAGEPPTQQEPAQTGTLPN